MRAYSGCGTSIVSTVACKAPSADRIQKKRGRSTWNSDSYSELGPVFYQGDSQPTQ
ncbi:hypothetical protein P170DRAFT_440003 [Aspergillus steynii IBT 23096]|uniref:Uncharacterized protein n=1 Tax=Aspergillus steynii IBT 23096 TaxID=1392250 RepID=A0A2I2FVW3_9EURO|nr:uncharacterized protein P170DRAFT_440003 [Aspergillus steynii IBT 23096]PLB44755.1 hypothetical protein P170DRAFT_440003 [Aspergillus steynii IBT 23096]